MRAPLWAALALAFLAVAGTAVVWAGLNLTLGWNGGWWTKHFIDISPRQVARRLTVIEGLIGVTTFLVLYL